MYTVNSHLLATSLFTTDASLLWTGYVSRPQLHEMVVGAIHQISPIQWIKLTQLSNTFNPLDKTYPVDNANQPFVQPSPEVLLTLGHCCRLCL